MRPSVSVADLDGVFPDGFYSTTNLATQVRLDGHWLDVENPEMDCGLVVDGERVYTLPMSDVKVGMQVVTGASGIKVTAPVIDEGRATPSASWSPTSRARSRRPCWSGRSPTACARPRPPARRCCGSAAPASCTPAPRPPWWRWSTPGYVDVLFAGNALATHDIESSLYGTSLGVDLAMGRGVEHGHEHHIRALNTIRKAGLDQGRGRATAS